MAKPRIVETNQGIQDEGLVEIFDRFSQNMRDRGFDNVNEIVRAGIVSGNVLEIGPGPGYKMAYVFFGQAQRDSTGISIII